MLRVSEIGQSLVIDYPAWLGILLIGLGVALAFHLVRSAAWRTRTFGMVAATLLLLFAGVYFLTYKVTIGPDDGRAYAFPGGSRRIEWGHAASIDTEQRHGRGNSTWIVVRTAAGAVLEINVTGLSGPEENRVREYITARVNK